MNKKYELSNQSKGKASMKPFDLESAKRGELIARVSGTCNAPVNFIGVTSYGEIVVEHLVGTVGVVNPKYLFMAEPKRPERPEWQQKLIDAAKSGKVIEVNFIDLGSWVESSLNSQLDNYIFRDRTEDQFRIRPDKVTRYLWAFKYPTSQWRLQSSVFMSDEEAKSEFSDCETQRLDWSATEFEE